MTEIFCEVESTMPSNTYDRLFHDYTSPFASTECLSVVLRFAGKREASIIAGGIGTPSQTIILYDGQRNSILVPWPVGIPLDTNLDQALTILIGEVTARLVIEKRREIDNHPFGYLANLIERGIEPKLLMPGTVRSLRRIAETIEWSETPFPMIQIGFAALNALYREKATFSGFLEEGRAENVAAISGLISHPIYGGRDVRIAANLWRLIAESFGSGFDRHVWRRETEMLAQWRGI